MILGEVPGGYVLRDFYTYLLFDVANPLGDVAVIPPKECEKAVEYYRKNRRLFQGSKPMNIVATVLGGESP